MIFKFVTKRVDISLFNSVTLCMSKMYVSGLGIYATHMLCAQMSI